MSAKIWRIFYQCSKFQPRYSVFVQNISLWYLVSLLVLPLSTLTQFRLNFFNFIQFFVIFSCPNRWNRFSSGMTKQKSHVTRKRQFSKKYFSYCRKMEKFWRNRVKMGICLMAGPSCEMLSNCYNKSRNTLEEEAMQSSLRLP